MPYAGSNTPRVDQALAAALGVEIVGDDLVDAASIEKAIAEAPAWLAGLVAVARECEVDADKYRFACDAALAGVWLTVMPTIELPDDQLDAVMRSAGWLGEPTKYQPFPEAWNTMRNRVRRACAVHHQALSAYVLTGAFVRKGE